MTNRAHAPRASRKSLLRRLSAEQQAKALTILAYVTAHPGADAGDVGRALRIATGTAARILVYLEAQGRVTHRKDGYHLTPAQPAPVVAASGAVVVERHEGRGLVVVRRTTAPPYSMVLTVADATEARVAREVARLTAMSA